MDAEIYIITNLVNNKVYIGITKKKYGSTTYGYKQRFKKHIHNALGKTRNKECPKLYNAINKYGKDSFTIKLLEECTLENRAILEKQYISKYNSTDDRYGYNISLGGDGRSVALVDEDIRNKISKSQSKNGECNIKPYYNNGIQKGYYVKRRQDGKVIQKYFTSTKNTLEANYLSAKEFLADIKQNNINKYIPYNRETNLPKNISTLKNKKKTVEIGYLVLIKKHKIRKHFTNDTMENNLLNAKKYLEEVKTIYMNSGKPDSNNPQPSS